MFHKKRKQTYAPEYLSIAGVATCLEISERLAHQLIHDKSDPIPHSRLGKRLIRVRKEELFAWMEKRRGVV